MKDVVISINSIHRLEDSEPDRIDFTTDGKYSYEDGTGYLSYMESEVTGLPGTRTSVEIRPDEVIVDRTGSITSRMVFRRGETQRIRHDIGAKGGSVEIDYVLDVEHAVVERNRFTLSVREQ